MNNMDFINYLFVVAAFDCIAMIFYTRTECWLYAMMICYEQFTQQINNV